MNPEVRTDQEHPGRAARKVARNTFFLAAADVANKVTMFVFYLMAARHLGVREFGVLSFALAFVTMFAVFTDLGLGALTAREIARDRSVTQRHVSNSIAIKAIATAVVITVVMLLANLLGYPPETVRVVYICAFFVFENAFTLYYASVFQGLERMEFTALSRVLQTGVLFAGVVLLYRGPASAEKYAWLYVAAGLASVLFAGTAASTVSARPALRPRPREWMPMLRSALPMGLAAIFTVLYYWNGLTLLSKLQGEASVGVYSASFRLVLGLVFISLAFGGALYPLMSRLHVTDSERLALLIHRSLKYMIVLALPVGALGTVLAGPAVRLLYGSAYSSSTPVLQVLVWWSACVCLNTVLSSYFVAVNRARVVTAQTALALGINVTANVTLIPWLGAVGAAGAILLAEAVSVAFLLAAQKQIRGLVDSGRLAAVAGQVALATVPATAAAWLLVRSSLFISLPAALACYVAAVLLLRVVSRDEVLWVAGLVRSKHS